MIENTSFEDRIVKLREFIQNVRDGFRHDDKYSPVNVACHEQEQFADALELINKEMVLTRRALFDLATHCGSHHPEVYDKKAHKHCSMCFFIKQAQNILENKHGI